MNLCVINTVTASVQLSLFAAVNEKATPLLDVNNDGNECRTKKHTTKLLKEINKMDSEKQNVD